VNYTPVQPGMPTPTVCSMRTRLRSCISICVVTLALASSSCGSDIRRDGDGAETTDIGRTLDEILPPPEKSFEVVYEVSGDIPGSGWAAFAWRQGDGRRRWDAVWQDADGRELGVFYVQDKFIEGAPSRFSEVNVRCVWERNSDSSVDAEVSCAEDTPGRPLVMNVLWRYLSARVIRSVDGETFAGQRTDCYEIGSAALQNGAICIEPTEGLPLFFAGYDGIASTPEVVRAIAIDANPVSIEIVIPTPLPRTDLNSSANLLLEDLGLPKHLSFQASCRLRRRTPAATVSRGDGR